VPPTSANHHEKRATVLAPVKGSLRRFEPLTEPPRRGVRMLRVTGKGGGVSFDFSRQPVAVNRWMGLDESTRIRSEGLIAEALSACTKIMGRDQKVIEKAHEIRQSILSRLRTSSKGREYLASIPPTDLRPPVIVDDSV